MKCNVVLLIAPVIMGLSCFKVFNEAKVNPGSEDNSHCSENGERVLAITGGFFHWG